jgi:hypothetical protein
MQKADKKEFMLRVRRLDGRSSFVVVKSEE